MNPYSHQKVPYISCFSVFPLYPHILSPMFASSMLQLLLLELNKILEVVFLKRNSLYPTISVNRMSYCYENGIIAAI